MSEPRVILKPGKITVLLEDGRGLVIRLRRKAEQVREEFGLIPRWRLAGAQTFSAFCSATAFSHDGYLAGGILGLVAVFLTWAASR